MAGTQVSDIVEIEVFAPYVQVLTAQLSDFAASGVVVSDEDLSNFLAGGGQTLSMPQWDDLDNTNANVSTDQLLGVNDATPLKLGSSLEIAIRNNRNQHWSVATLSGDLAGSDPFNAIAVRVAEYWVREEQRTIIAQCQGIMLDNVNDSDDMLNSIVLPGAGTPTADNLWSAEAFLDTIQTMGDAGKALRAFSVHSVVYNRMRKNDLIDFIPDSEGKFSIPTYEGLRVIVDDGMPAVANNGNFRYSTYLYGEGFLRRGVGTPKFPATTSREELAGQGGGQEFLHSRVKFAYHPRGFSFINAAGIALESPTNVEMAAASSWNRVRERKLARFAELRTNG
jgi:hypothetical protein